ncbi:hypothetical protein [Stenotrophomonas sp. G4]|uniref:hypothetical protein n=1 Tax=Stenotrophomonas sp. G4 TaxID=2303750 RepID=UPI000E3D30D1|nr:hypothetical protein [Stenotrophomonas sp. G4]
MASHISFMIPAAGKPSITFVPRAFLGQFALAAPAVQNLLSPYDAGFLAAAADCGYGNSKFYRVHMTLGDRKDLLRYLRRQGKQVRSLFSVAPSAPGGSLAVALKPYVATLQSSERASLGYAIGSIYARVATESWHAHPARAKGGPPPRFWHFSIAGHAAVQVMGIGKNHESDSPDYIVEDATGKWSAVEAKGSLGSFDNRNACDGMKQACKFERIAFLCPITHVIRVHPIGDRVCVYTYVDGSNELQTIHIDPPGEGVRDNAEWDGNLIIAEAADLVRFDEAMMQYISLVGRLPYAGPYRPAEVIWAPSLDDQGTMYGVLGVHANMWSRVRRAVSILEFITPWISHARRLAVDLDAAEIDLRSFSEFLSTVQTAGGPLLSDDPESVETRLSACYQLFNEMKEMERPSTWKTAMELLWTSDLLRTQSEDGWDLPTSINKIWEAIKGPISDTIRSHYRQQALDELLPGNPAHASPEEAVSSHGLFVRVQSDVRNRGVAGVRGFG